MGDIDNILKEMKVKPSAEYKLVYDSSSETLEPLYFWFLDFMNGMFGGDIEKLTDNFASSPGSGHFSELGGKMTQMQQEASRSLATINTILKSVMNLIYDLKEFQIRLSHYDYANSKDKNEKEAGILALKQIWMDKVDVQRGQGSINALSSGNLQFVTLRDAFMRAQNIKDVEKFDLNDRVIRILKPRVQEFFEWKTRSENELRKRFELEKVYLKSQVDSLKLQAKWARPYLRNAQRLSQNEGLISNPALVTTFNTVLLELTLIGKKAVKVEEATYAGDLPKEFKNMKLRKYYSVVFADFLFRGIPNKVGQHYTMGGRAEVKFRSYGLREDEIKKLKEKLTDRDLESSLQLVEGATTDSLQQLELDLKEFLEDNPEKKKEKENSEDINPFSALFAPLFKKKAKSKEEEKDKKQKKENYAEKYVRNFAAAAAANSCFSIYDIYKKAHGMASIPYSTPVETQIPKSKAEDLFGF